MVNHDLISSYLDNELTREQEQEFLISLAANEQLHQAFRSELILNRVVRRDEAMTIPPRDMRSTILSTIGLAGAFGAAVTDKVVTSGFASQSVTFFKALVATKVNTLITAAGLSLAAFIGFTTNDVLTEAPVATMPAATTTSAPTEPEVSMPAQAQPESTPASELKAVAEPTVQKEVAVRKSTKSTSTTVEPAGSGEPDASTSLPQDAGARLNMQPRTPKK